MADSSSRAFNPPAGAPRDTDPMVMKVPMDSVDFGFRKSQTPPMRTEGMGLSHVKDGK